jgi:hypothetical protein
MVIEESLIIRAPVKKTWDVFVDLTCWADWNRVLTDISASDMCLTDGSGFRCCMRPYFFTVYFEPKVSEVIPYRKVVWTAGKFGISSLHEFLFEERPEGVEIISRERFKGVPVLLGAMLFLEGKIRELTVSFLDGLRQAAEA